MSTSLFDQGWFSSLPSFWSAPGDDYDPAASSTTPSRSTFRQPNSKHTIVSTSSGKEGGQQADMPKVKGRKSNAQQKKNKAYTKKDVHPAERQTAPKPSSLSTTAPSSSAYPRAFYNDDLASSPLNAPRRSTVPLPQSYEDNPFFFAAAKGDSHSASASSVRSFVRPAVDDEHGQEQQQVRDVSLSASSGFTLNSTSVASTEFDYSGDDDEELEGVYEYASDAEDADIDDVDDERPFPSPQKAKQEKYFRRAADFGLYSPSSTASSPELHPVDANKAKSHAKGKGKALSAAASWADPSLLPPPIAPSSTHYSHPSAAAAPLITPSTAHGSYSKISHLNQLPAPTPTVTTLPPSPPAAALDAYYSPPAAALESPSDKFPRGRNPHPRLLWRSLLDKEALAVLDAHHDRIVGGPLPRLAVVDASEEGVKFGASGIERERDHAGAREEGERGRSREERRFRAGGGRGRREWSVEGRRWSREVERCGL